MAPRAAQRGRPAPLAALAVLEAPTRQAEPQSTASDSRCTTSTQLFADASAFFADYELGEQLGEGTFGRVRVATHKPSGQRFAVKQVPLVCDGHNRLPAIEHEVANWSAVQHCPSVCRLHAVYKDDESAYLVQQLCEGGDLQSVLDIYGSLEESEARCAMAGVLEALAACHTLGIAFCDVKPSNFMVPSLWPSLYHLMDPSKPKGELRTIAIDFGCSQSCAQGCHVEGLSGTIAYMAPEALRDRRYSLPVDVWAAGVMLFVMLTGRFPFWPDVQLADFGRLSPRRVMQDISAFRDTDLQATLAHHASCAHLSEDAKQLLRNMLAVEPANRISAQQALASSWMQQAGSQ